LEDIESAARNQYEALKNKTSIKIQYELQSKKTMDLNLNISVCVHLFAVIIAWLISFCSFQAPHVLIPENFADPNSPVLFLDLGRLSLYSIPKIKPEKFVIGKLDEKNEMEYYDQFMFDMSNLQVLITTVSKVRLDDSFKKVSVC
jgi:hypothetical protein